MQKIKKILGFYFLEVGSRRFHTGPSAYLTLNSYLVHTVFTLTTQDFSTLCELERSETCTSRLFLTHILLCLPYNTYVFQRYGIH